MKKYSQRFILKLYSVFGLILVKILPRSSVLRLSSVHYPKKFTTAKIVQHALCTFDLFHLIELNSLSVELFELVDDQLKDKYMKHTSDVGFRLTGIYPTDGVLIWLLIKKFQPSILIETGTGTAVSSVICLKALREFTTNSKFVTIGTATNEVVRVARKNLQGFSDVTMIEGFAPDDLIETLDEVKEQSVGFFIDGPKGSSPDFWRLLEDIFTRLKPVFIALHDCEEHIASGFDTNGKYPSGHINITRVQLIAFYEKYLKDNYKLIFMKNKWCEKNDDLNEIIYQSESSLNPYYFKGTRQKSHSPFLGILIRR
jgi:predicted O-methyltransferase YrrM